jgi:hypothetical protein
LNSIEKKDDSMIEEIIETLKKGLDLDSSLHDLKVGLFKYDKQEYRKRFPTVEKKSTSNKSNFIFFFGGEICLCVECFFFSFV